MMVPFQFSISRCRLRVSQTQGIMSGWQRRRAVIPIRLLHNYCLIQQIHFQNHKRLIFKSSWAFSLSNLNFKSKRKKRKVWNKSLFIHSKTKLRQKLMKINLLILISLKKNYFYKICGGETKCSFIVRFSFFTSPTLF